METKNKTVEINEPLNPSINNTDRESMKSRNTIQVIEDKLESQMEMFKKIFNLGIYPIIGMIFHPAYIITNTIVFKEDPAA